MDYLSISSDERQRMLAVIGVSGFEELLATIPDEVRLQADLVIGPGQTEYAVGRAVRALSSLNANCTELICFAGAGCYDHYIPSFIDHILRKPEFFTAYTPYQPEVSQGTLQAIFEYQSAMCRLTGMQVANASMYDGATALAEAALMSIRAQRAKRHTVIASASLNPQWLDVLETYASAGIMDIRIVASGELIESIDDDTASLLVGYPNFFGEREDISPLIQAAHTRGALAVIAASPLMLALWESPGALGADIVIGEAQCFGNPMSFGGPGLGFFAATEHLMRNMPGRIVGRTSDVDGSPGYVLTLSTREQHIRREKATSNICSNHALNALAAGAYLRFMGHEGLTEIAQSCVDNAHRLYQSLLACESFEPFSDLPFGYEFTLRYRGRTPLDEWYARLIENGYLPGVIAGEDTLVIAVTEKRTENEISAFSEEACRASL